MISKRAIGLVYEKKALEILKENGYTLVRKNYISKAGEIDLIVKKDNLLVFVEVKYRKNHKYGYGFEVVDIKKQKRIFKSAMKYLVENKYDKFSMRFDVISFNGEEYNWIENCFWGDELGF